jgi:D-sedoheptulose 7-phosphate isomerase
MELNEQSWRQAIEQHLSESADVKRSLIDSGSAQIVESARLISDAFAAGRKLLICGNGGSAADSQHMAAEFTSRLSMDFVRPGLPAIALTCDTSFLTAYANDFDFEGVFARQVQALGQSGDVLLGISTSGNSRNVLAAVREARPMGLKTIVLTGSGGQLQREADVAIAVPAEKTQYIQEAHLAIEHLICFMVERMVFGEDGQVRGAARAG